MANYRVTIDPDVDFPEEAVEKIVIDVDNDIGVPLDFVPWWFQTELPDLTGTYTVTINPDVDFADDSIQKPVIDVDNLLGISMETVSTWFRIYHVLSRHTITINPVNNLIIGSLQTMIAGITSDELAVMDETWWFRIGFFWEWVNLQEDDTELKGQLQRFLKLVSFTLDGVKAYAENQKDMIDVDRTDADFLPYLAALVGTELSFEIPISKQRELIKRAVAIYRTKGTLPAIRRFFRNILGLIPTLDEWPPRMLFSNDATKVSAKITTPGEMDLAGLPGDNAFYSLDFSKKGDYRFDKFGIYLYLLEGTGILKSEIENVIRTKPKHIPASTVGKIIFVDFTYLITELGAALSNLWFAFGTGDPAWDGVVVPPTGGESTLENEIYRRQPDGQVYLDGSGYVTETPTNLVRLTIVVAENNSPMNDNNIREMGIFGGAANGALDSGTLYGLARHKGQWITDGHRIRKTFEMTI